jgi:hypothetical protein
MVCKRSISSSFDMGGKKLRNILLLFFSVVEYLARFVRIKAVKHLMVIRQLSGGENTSIRSSHSDSSKQIYILFEKGRSDDECGNDETRKPDPRTVHKIFDNNPHRTG